MGTANARPQRPGFEHPLMQHLLAQTHQMNQRTSHLIQRLQSSRMTPFHQQHPQHAVQMQRIQQVMARGNAAMVLNQDALRQGIQTAMAAGPFRAGASVAPAPAAGV